MTKNTDKCPAWLKLIILVFLSMMGGLLLLTWDTHTVASETKGEVKILKWVMENHKHSPASDVAFGKDFK